MGTLNKVALITPTVVRPGAALALLDRFLAGYPQDGAFVGRLAPVMSVSCSTPAADELGRRVKDFGLTTASSLEAAASGADGVVIVPLAGTVAPPTGDVERVLQGLVAGSSCLVVGNLAAREADAVRLLELAKRRGVRLGAAGLLSVTFRLPDVRHRGGRCREGLIVVQGEDGNAKADGVLGLKPELNLAPAMDVAVRRYDNDAVWRAGATGEWSWDLLAAALSRTNNAQGDSVTDGRTQDLVGLGMVQRLAQRPRVWVTDHAEGGRTAILALDGVVKDVNLATRDRSGVVSSAQLYRPPAPNEAGYHRLAGVVAGFLKGGPLPWPERRDVEMAAWWEALT